ncbi:MAG: hypothetical protein F6K19_44155 [Cyanothece sp. SIO1E1]|nr:hypothetical protein [Cyanothece sp. SIO1E1]
MISNQKPSRIFADAKVDVRIKLSALWAATMFCYLYADILSLYRSEFLEQIMIGEIIGFQINQAFLLESAVLMSIPTIMIFLSLILSPKVNRYANMILGVAHIGLAITLSDLQVVVSRNPCLKKASLNIS